MNLTTIDYLVLPLLDWDGIQLDSLLAGLGIEPSVEDLCILGRFARQNYSCLDGSPSLHFNPIFTLSSELGGADADLIASGTLVDWKATSTRSVAGRQAFWQLLGYLLADMEDQFAITSIELGALRWGTRARWSVPEFLEELSGGRRPPLKTLRLEFASVVICAHHASMRRREVARAEYAERKRRIAQNRRLPPIQ